MNPLFGKAAFIVSLISMMLIRAPHGKRSGQVKIRESRKGPLEIAFLALMGIATLVLPVISIVGSLLSFADYGSIADNFQILQKSVAQRLDLPCFVTAVYSGSGFESIGLLFNNK